MYKTLCAPTRKCFCSFLIVSMLSLAFLISSCNSDDADLSSEEIEQVKSQLQEQISSNQFLLSWENKSDYIFDFGTQTVNVPASLLKEVIDDEENWQTKLVFSDNSALIIPTKGTSLAHVIKRVRLNPSGYNPLAAEMDIHFPLAGRAKVTIRGKEGSTGTVTHTFQALKREQTLPIIGLYADYENIVELTYLDENDNEIGHTQTTIKTEPLEVKRLPTFRVDVKLPEEMEPGMNMVSYPGETEIDISTPYIVDNDGEIRWILLLDNSSNLKHYNNQRGLKRTSWGTYISGDMTTNEIYEFDILGNITNQWDIGSKGYDFHHEITETKDGNFLISVTKQDAKLPDGTPRIYDFIIELDPSSGSILKTWDLANMLDITRYPEDDNETPEEFAPSRGNWGQNNSIKERGSDLMVGMRFQGIFSFTRGEKLKWAISPHKGWGQAYQRSLLTPLDAQGNKITDEDVILGNKAHKDFDWVWGPHSPIDMPNGHILVFDNGYKRHFIDNAVNPDGNYSRVVEYKIDEEEMTIQQVWSYGKDRGKETFSSALGAAHYLPETGNVLFGSGTLTRTKQGRGGHIIEVNPKTNKRVFELEITPPGGIAFHEAYRIKLYPDTL